MLPDRGKPDHIFKGDIMEVLDCKRAISCDTFNPIVGLKVVITAEEFQDLLSTDDYAKFGEDLVIKMREYLDEPTLVSYKGMCIECGYLNPDAISHYKCRCTGDCPATDNSQDKIDKFLKEYDYEDYDKNTD